MIYRQIFMINKVKNRKAKNIKLAKVNFERGKCYERKK